MRLPDLLTDIEVATIRGEVADGIVGSVTCDSRTVSPGDVFVCIDGVQMDGHAFIAEAVARGAGAVVVDARRIDTIDTGVTVHARQNAPFGSPSNLSTTLRNPAIIGVDNTRLAYALLCAAAAGHPAQLLHLVGVTGTNGKTTTVFLIDAIYRAAGYRTALVSTVSTRIGDDNYDNDDGGRHRLTTPDAGELQRILHHMWQRRVERGVVEISSHALSMHRLGGCRLRAGVFTNMSRDHLDFHGGWEQYFHAKRRLLSLLDEDGHAVINVDDRWGHRLAADAGDTVVDYGLYRSATVRGHIIERGIDYNVVGINTPDGYFTTKIQLPGTGNVYNALAAAATAWADGVSVDQIANGLAEAPEPPGRFQQIRQGQPFRVIVDFAHNPEALLHALRAIQPRAGGALWLVFGCKGDDEDDRKRRLMGRIAARAADHILVTTDNPLGESPALIADIVARAIWQSGVSRHNCRIILDRREAIRVALTAAAPGDVVVIAGRGHEQEQLFGSDAVSLDDGQFAGDVLAEIYGSESVTSGVGADEAGP